MPVYVNSNLPHCIRKKPGQGLKLRCTQIYTLGYPFHVYNNR